MKVITSNKYRRPTFEGKLVKLERINGNFPEFVEVCKYVDKVLNEVYFYNGSNHKVTLSRESVE